MRTYPSNDIKDKWGLISETAQREHVTITKRGRPSLVMMSSSEYESLRGLYISDLKAKLEEGIRAADNGEFSTMTLEEMLAEGRKRLHSEGS